MSATPPVRDPVQEALELYERAKLLRKNLDRESASLLIQNGEDAIKLFGTSHQKEKVELQKMLADAREFLPPETFADYWKRAQRALLEFLYRFLPPALVRPLLLVTAIVVVALGVRQFWPSKPPAATPTTAATDNPPAPKATTVVNGLRVPVLDVVAEPSSPGEMTFKFHDIFLNHYKARATINIAAMQISKVGKIHSPQTDGDQHFSGTSESVYLPIVAELMNAKDWPQAKAIVEECGSKQQACAVSGAWRLWPERGSRDGEVQGGETETIASTNPEHIFEVHPVTKINNLDLSGTLVPIEGFTPKAAETAFAKFEATTLEISRDPATKMTTLRLPRVGFNYVEFVMRIEGEQIEIADGRLVLASVFGKDNKLLVEHCRMIFVRNTPPERAVRQLKPGEQLHVIGTPRISLEAVQKAPASQKQKLPYEMIIVGVYQ